MGDMGELYKAHKESRTTKKLENLEYSTALLVSEGIAFESKNSGIHLIIRHNGHIVDFWPSTGKFKVRGSNKFKRGVKRLIKEINKCIN